METKAPKEIDESQEPVPLSMSVALFGCVTQHKYTLQLVDCVRSWIVDAEKSGVTVKIFVGEIMPDTPQELLPYLVSLHCGDGYESATPKHWYGLEYMYKNHPADWYYTCGSDTYLQVSQAQQLLSTLDPSKSLYVGGHGDTRRWDGVDYYYHSGGPGYMFSRAAMDRIAPETEAIMKSYFSAPNMPAWFTFCDVQAGYVAHKLGLECVKVQHRFFHCRPGGDACNRGHPPIDLKTMVACHLMTHEDFKKFYRL